MPGKVFIPSFLSIRAPVPSSSIYLFFRENIKVHSTRESHTVGFRFALADRQTETAL